MNLDPAKDDWKEVKVKGYRIFAFSAFLDDQSPVRPLIRVLGAAPTNYAPFASFISCDLFQEDGQFLTTLPSVVRRQVPCHRFSNCSMFFESDLSLTSKLVFQLVRWVSLRRTGLLGKNDTKLPHLRLHRLALSKPQLTDGTFVACIKPFYGAWNSPLALIEFIEMYKILGVSHFVFYENLIGKEARLILDFYSAQGFATIFHWTLPFSRKDILPNAHLTCINDCKMRVINRFEYLVHVDVDEFILPRNRITTLHGLIQDIHQKERNENRSSTAIGSYTFLNMFYYKEFGKGGNGDASKVLDKFTSKLNTQAYVKRSPAYYPYKIRSKYIARPNATDYLTVHFTSVHSNGNCRFF